MPRRPEGEPFETEGIIEEGEGAEKRIEPERLSAVIVQALTNDLKEHDISERVVDIPISSQEYTTDCNIVCARMAMVYYGLRDPGTDGFVRQAEQLGLGVTRTEGADGKEGPEGDPSLIQNFFLNTEKENKISTKMSHFIPEADRAAEFANAIKNGEPVQLSIDYRTLYPEGKSDLPRNHAVLVKGYRLGESGELVLVANDPKPKVGGEREISQSILTEALQSGFIIYQRADTESSDVEKE